MRCPNTTGRVLRTSLLQQELDTSLHDLANLATEPVDAEHLRRLPIQLIALQPPHCPPENPSGRVGNFLGGMCWAGRWLSGLSSGTRMPRHPAGSSPAGHKNSPLQHWLFL